MILLTSHNFLVNQPVITSGEYQGFLPQLAAVSDYYAMLKDPVFIECYGVTYSEEEAEERMLSDMSHWDQYGFGHWMWYHGERFVGRVGLKHYNLEGVDEVELAYAIHPAYWGKSVAMQLGASALQYGFQELQLKSIICFTSEKNKQSLRVMEKLKFKYERNFIHNNGDYKLHRLHP